MAENPLRRFGRLLGGVALMNGGIGHQVLGQLLIADSGDAVMAGAMMVIAGSSRQRNLVAQAAVRTAAPTLAARWFLRSRELQLKRREAGLAELELTRHKVEILTALMHQRAGRRVVVVEAAAAVPPAPQAVPLPAAAPPEAVLPTVAAPLPEAAPPPPAIPLAARERRPKPAPAKASVRPPANRKPNQVEKKNEKKQKKRRRQR
ncbi:MAG: hypothetical protein Q8O42_13775 [Acidobacteriota bacterium]|nr:hypothetical protein [Acidobacteriota bacterium]